MGPRCEHWSVAAREGFEPSHAGSEPAVLPLDDLALRLENAVDYTMRSLAVSMRGTRGSNGKVAKRSLHGHGPRRRRTSDRGSIQGPRARERTDAPLSSREDDRVS